MLMTGLVYLGYALVMLIAVYQIFVSIVIWRAEEFEQIQRAFQLGLIWLIPIFGALGCHLFLRSQRNIIHNKDNGFVQQEPDVEVGFGDVHP